MNDLRKSAQMALNHLLSFDPIAWSPETAEKLYAAITELRTGLAQPEQKPIIWTTLAELNWALRNPGRRGLFYAVKDGPLDIPLYTHPPKRKPLHPDKIREIADKQEWVLCEPKYFQAMVDLVRATEAEHGIGGEHE